MNLHTGIAGILLLTTLSAYGAPVLTDEAVDEGTAITSNRLLAEDQDSCLQACQTDNRDRVKECDIYYPSESQPVPHRECLDKAKSKFDACTAACRASEMGATRSQERPSPWRVRPASR